MRVGWDNFVDDFGLPLKKHIEFGRCEISAIGIATMSLIFIEILKIGL